MMYIPFRITLLSDASFSDRARTAGGHETRPYIPGSALLGACAARLYRDLSADDAFTVFHSGKVRFMNAYPVAFSGEASSVAEEETVPMPFSLHRQKGVEHAPALNFIRFTPDELQEMTDKGIQHQQIRRGFLGLQGSEVGTKTTYRLKTAIDRAMGGRAAEGQLYGYEALEGGTVWHGAICFDDDVQVVQKQVLDGLNGDIRLGKSRTAEFGQARFEVLQKRQMQGTKAAVEDGRVVLYCKSDLALTDPVTGMPTLTPQAEHFCLPADSRFDASSSFVRTRSYAPFNGQRRAFDCERYVISAGSVLVFDVKSAVSDDCVRVLSAGVGDYLAEGLGDILLNPSFLRDRETALVKKEIFRADKGAAAPAMIDSELRARLLERRIRRLRGNVTEEALGHVSFVLKHCPVKDGFPGKSQWSQVRTIAQKARTMQELMDGLFGDKGLCVHGVSKTKWAAEFWIDTEPRSCASHLKDQIIGETKDFEKVRGMLMIVGSKVSEGLKGRK
ncbi:MAG: hypothetical protein GX423_13030 [Nitrospiraceae bacterium]|jgi:CRISPR-associated protein Csx10|nr:hypothetical protein [Nitrospiraceae bacterium]